MLSIHRLTWLALSCLLMLSGCATTKYPSPSLQPRPAIELDGITEADLVYCDPLVADDGTLPSMLKVDAINNGAHIDCQWRERGFVDALRQLVEGGVVVLGKAKPIE